MTLTAKHSPLVRGAAVAAPQGQMRLRLVRAICITGQRLEAGTYLQHGQVDMATAAELVSAGKAERVPAPVPVPPPAPAQPALELQPPTSPTADKVAGSNSTRRQA
jgi:hypothetical protein